MRKQMKVIYHHHSGFSIQINSRILIFDYWRGESGELPVVAQLLPTFLKRFSAIYVFVSHAHPDHLDPVIYSWANDISHIEYILGEGVTPPDSLRRARILQAGDSVNIPGGVSVTAYPSTDLGVSFYVEVDGLKIFHAGDLNLWHWRDESTLEEINRAEEDYENALRAIGTLHMDLCMFPVDPRQGSLYTLGAERFILMQRPLVFLPMHFFEYDYAAVNFAYGNKSPYSKVIAMTREGTQLNLTYDDSGQADGAPVMVTYDLLEPPKKHVRKSVDGAEAGSPFEDSDLPVSLEENQV